MESATCSEYEYNFRCEFFLSGSVRANSVAASIVEHALSEVASSVSSYHPRPGPQQAWLLQVQIWLLIARLYLKLDQLSEANACIHEAANIFPLSHHIMYMVRLTTTQDEMEFC